MDLNSVIYDISGWFTGNDAGACAILDDIQELISQKDFDRALEISGQLAKTADARAEAADSSQTEYYNFTEPMEEVVYREFYKPEKQLEYADFPFADIYTLHGDILFQLERYRESAAFYRKAIRWNPIAMKYTWRYMEAEKKSGSIDKYGLLALHAFSNVFRTSDLLQCYMDLAYYFTEKQWFAEAAGCYVLILRYDPDYKPASASLTVLEQLLGEEFYMPTLLDVRKYAHDIGFPLGVNKTLLNSAYAYALDDLQSKNMESALYFLDIVYDLSQNDEVKTLLDSIKTKIIENRTGIE